MSALSNKYKSLKEVNIGRDIPEVIQSPLDLVSGGKYIKICIFPNDGHHKPCENEEWEFAKGINKEKFEAKSKTAMSNYYTDNGIIPYTPCNKWNGVHFTIRKVNRIRIQIIRRQLKRRAEKFYSKVDYD